MTRGERLVLWFGLLCGIVALFIASAPAVQAVTGWRFFPLVMSMYDNDDPGCPPLAATRGDDAAWVVICSTNRRQFNGSFFVVQTPTSIGPFVPNTDPPRRFASMTVNAGWINYLYPHQSSDMEFLGTCNGVDWDGAGHHCGFNFKGDDNSLFLGFQDGILGRPDIPFGIVYTKKLGTTYGTCPSGGECIPVSFGGLTRYVRVTTG